MNVRREPAKRPDHPVPQTRGAPAAQDRGGRATARGGWSGTRQVIELVLLGILALTGLATVTLSSTGGASKLVFGALIISLVVAVGIGRAAYRARR